MNKTDHNAEQEKIIKNLGGTRPRLLLHACCAPCSSACLERLKDDFNITVFFYNPNIEDAEYKKRKAELIRFISETGWADIDDCEHDVSEFYEIARGLEGCPEGGARCAKCFELRLSRAAREAAEKGYDMFATTLTLSPLKNAELINNIGYAAGERYGAVWLPSDFKKKNGYLRSIELSRRYNLYRQNFCGCVYSARDSAHTPLTK